MKSIEFRNYVFDDILFQHFKQVQLDKKHIHHCKHKNVLSSVKSGQKTIKSGRFKTRQVQY